MFYPLFYFILEEKGLQVTALDFSSLICYPDIPYTPAHTHSPKNTNYNRALITVARFWFLHVLIYAKKAK